MGHDARDKIIQCMCFGLHAGYSAKIQEDNLHGVSKSTHPRIMSPIVCKIHVLKLLYGED